MNTNEIISKMDSLYTNFPVNVENDLGINAAGQHCYIYRFYNDDITTGGLLSFSATIIGFLKWGGFLTTPESYICPAGQCVNSGGNDWHFISSFFENSSGVYFSGLENLSLASNAGGAAEFYTCDCYIVYIK